MGIDCCSIWFRLLSVQVIHCIENGLPLLIENLPEDIDPVMDSVIQKKVGSRLYV